MQPTFEKWDMSIKGKIFVISKEEMESIVNAGEARFVKFRDMIINPAYVEYMVKTEFSHKGEIEAPDETDVPSDEWLEKRIKK